MRRLTIVMMALTLGGAGDVLAKTKHEHAASRHPARVASEHLRFSATWNGVPVARAELLIDPHPNDKGGTVALEGRAETTEVLALLWQMRDGFESTIATSPIAPQHFLLRQHENDRRRETSVTADPSRGVLVGSKHKHGRPANVTTVPFARDVHDPASLAYLIRTRGPDLHARETYRVFTGSKTFELSVAPAGDEAIMTIGRSWKSRKLNLSLRLDDAASDGGTQPQVQEAELWVSSGPERLPLRMQAKTYWGWVVIELVGRGALPRQTTTTRAERRLLGRG